MKTQSFSKRTYLFLLLANTCSSSTCNNFFLLEKYNVIQMSCHQACTGVCTLGKEVQAYKSGELYREGSGRIVTSPFLFSIHKDRTKWRTLKPVFIFLILYSSFFWYVSLKILSLILKTVFSFCPLSLFFFLIIVFIYLLLGLLCGVGFSLVAASRACSLLVVSGLPAVAASPVRRHAGFSSRGSQA